MMKHGSQYNIYRSGNKQKNQQTITTKVVNVVRKYCLRLWAFVSVGEAFLFLFEALKVHHNSVEKGYKLIWSYSTISLEPNKRNDTQIG